jgi:hypothetical protein
MKNIYVLVGFHYEYAKNAAYLSRQETLYKRANPEKKGRMKFSDKVMINRLRAIIGSIPENIGYFETLEDAVKAVKENGHCMHEGAYYTTLCIEVLPFGCIDAYGEAVKWFRGHSTGEGWHDYEYRSCRKPRWSRGTFAFSR